MNGEKLAPEGSAGGSGNVYLAISGSCLPGSILAKTFLKERRTMMGEASRESVPETLSAACNGSGNEDFYGTSPCIKQLLLP